MVEQAELIGGVSKDDMNRFLDQAIPRVAPHVGKYFARLFASLQRHGEVGGMTRSWEPLSPEEFMRGKNPRANRRRRRRTGVRVKRRRRRRTGICGSNLIGEQPPTRVGDGDYPDVADPTRWT